MSAPQTTELWGKLDKASTDLRYTSNEGQLCSPQRAMHSCHIMLSTQDVLRTCHHSFFFITLGLIILKIRTKPQFLLTHLWTVFDSSGHSEGAQVRII